MVPPNGVYLPILKVHSILAVVNLLAHNNISQICYCGQISLQSAAVNCSFFDNLKPLGVPFILLAMVPLIEFEFENQSNQSKFDWFAFFCCIYLNYLLPASKNCGILSSLGASKKVLFS